MKSTVALASLKIIFQGLAKIRNLILDTLFPINCLSCGKYGVWLCGSCLEKIPLRTEQVCPVCEKQITPDGRVCFNCHRKSTINGLLSASFYQNKIISSVIHCFKYQFVKELANPLGEILTNSLLHSQLPIPEIIIPVPLHKRRLRWRGFNQAELLANYLSKNLTPGLTIPVINNLLIRSRFTSPQMGIKNHLRRKENIANAFSLNNQRLILNKTKNNKTSYHCDSNDVEFCCAKDVLKNKTILLVDDIATTGSTLFESAKVLKQNGAKEIYAIVIARQEYNQK